MSASTQKQHERVVAKIGKWSITVGEFSDLLRAQSAYLSASYDGPTGRKAFLDKIVRFEVLAAEAERRGIDKRPNMVRVREQAMVDAMMQDLFEAHGVKLSDVTDAEIASYYAAHPDEFSSQKLGDVKAVIQNQLWRARHDAAIQSFLSELRRKAAIRENVAKLDP